MPVAFLHTVIAMLDNRRNVVIVSDNYSVTDGIYNILCACTEFNTYAAYTLEYATHLLEQRRPDIVIINTDMYQSSNIVDLVGRLYPDCNLVRISDRTDISQFRYLSVRIPAITNS